MTFQTTQQAYCQAVGSSPTNSTYIATRDPTSNDINFIIGKFWQNTSNESLWYLNSFSSANGIVQADWITIDSSIQTLSDTANTTVSASSGTSTPPNNIQLTSLDATVTIVSDPTNNRITFSVNDLGVTWVDENVSFFALASHGYFVTGAATATLPASPDQGDTIIITSLTNSSVFVQANTGQEIVLGSDASTVGGTAVSNAQGSTIELVYRTSSSTWNTIASVGTWVLA